jgi:hypothetical protein
MENTKAESAHSTEFGDDFFNLISQQLLSNDDEKVCDACQQIETFINHTSQVPSLIFANKREELFAKKRNC